MEHLDVFALTPAGSADPAPAIAACRAGALGFLDLEYTFDPAAARAGLARLERFTSSPFGVKLGREGGETVPLLQDMTDRLSTILLAGGEHADLERWVRLLRSRPRRILLEAVSLAEARLGAALGTDGVVLKGNESGGRVGSDTAFILLQRWQASAPVGGKARLPVWVQGGIGLNTAAACAAGGAAGVVLDAQLLLARESALPDAARARLATCDGSETACAGERLGEVYRHYAVAGLASVEELRREEERLAAGGSSTRRDDWRQVVRRRVANDPARGVWLIGQDAAFARALAARYRTVGGIVQAVRQRAWQQRESARTLQPLATGSPLAQRHGTRYPIVQGPMTRVSDTAAFAEAVAEAGALPFLALALLRRAEAARLLEETRARLGGRPWGAGILGFAPPEVRREQIEAIRAARPPWALIAGGRPDQARELEREGIPTYLHVPSPGLLQLFLRDGARRFVFEGRECGGHVGPRSSFVLWETMCEQLLEHLGTGGSGRDLEVLFAGGVHDARSAAMVAALAAGLAERGVAAGVLLGTAYLFTAEAVATGAIVPRYQQEALRCRDTILLETGPGHAIRCVPTPYAEAFEREKARLRQEGCTSDEIREVLEALNVGRLRVASKGLDRAADEPRSFVTVAEDEQHRRGMYMIGQAAGLRDRVVSMAELHADVCDGGARLLEGTAVGQVCNLPLEAQGRLQTCPTAPAEKPSDVAIVGMACLMPGADGLRTFWENVLARVDAVTEVPADHWDWRLYYDPDPKAKDKISSKWGGFLGDMPFDPLAFGMPPNSLASIEPVQLFVLEVVRRALADAGYAERPFDRERTAVVLGAGGGAAQLAIAYSFRSYLPMLATVPGLGEQAAEIFRKAEAILPEWTEDSFPGILVNVIAGRVANRFNFGGPNFAVDAACGSSLAALYAGVRELEAGTSDVAVVVGADTVQNPYTYLAFSKTHAFSPRGRCSTFDEAADGIVISEGVAVVVLKRLADAERDGDRIYAVIKGVGASSDGRDKGLTAPRPEGQLRALRRAYARAGISPARVGFIEAHGTGTVAGDQAEVQALGQVFREGGAAKQGCIVGSVKSMIGHTKCAAGLAGLVNATLALHHKALPPLLIQRPNPRVRFAESPFALNGAARPWVHGGAGPRCAGVSAFGFGGTNFHAVLEEYRGDYLAGDEAALQRWPAELMVWRRPTREALVAAVEDCHAALARGARPPLAPLAHSLWKACSAAPGLPILAVTAASVEDLRDRLAGVLPLLRSGQERVGDPRGVFFAANPRVVGAEVAGPGKVAFLFPGQGSQYPDMLAQAALAFPEVRAAFDEAERILGNELERPLGKWVFPPSAFSPEEEQRARRDLARTDVAQPALGAAGFALFRLLASLGIEPDLLAGHSYGDYAALCAAGALAFDDLVRLSHRRGAILRESAGSMPGAMAALEAGPDAVRRLLAGLDGVTAANFNGPMQTVLSGSEEGIAAALERARQEGIHGQRLAVACGFHSPRVEKAREPFARALAAFRFGAPRRPVYANTTAVPYPDDPAAVADLLAQHLTSPVRFHEEVEALYAAGARVFVEVGPQAVLTGLVGQILSGRPHLAVASDVKGRPGLVQLQHLLGQLLCAGVPVRLDRLFEGRDAEVIDLARLDEAGKEKLPSSTWLVNSVRVRPLHAPEPRLLGQSMPETPPRKPEVNGSNGAPHYPSRSAIAPTPAGNGHADVLPPLPAGDEAAQVMARFQELMTQFLETQRSVMLDFLQASGAPDATLPPMPAAPPAAPAPPPPTAAPPKESGTPPTPVKAAPAADPREAIAARLLDVVCQRTGYPREMLGLDLDLEADLGIDSIKRVEILGSLAEAGKNGGPAIAVEMETLTGIKTLRGILDQLVPVGSTGERGVSTPCLPPQQGVDTPRSPERQRGGIHRMTVAPAEVPLPEGVPSLPHGGRVVLLTDDGRGVARELAARLAEQGQRGVFLRLGTAVANGDPQAFTADLSDPRQVEEVLGCVREHYGPSAGLVHLLPLAAPPPGEGWDARLGREVQSLFLLARGLAEDLRGAAESGPAFLIAATSMGGAFGAGSPAGAPLPVSFFPGQGGVAGLVKSLAHEWPDVLVRVVDFEGDAPAPESAERLLAELADADGPVEVGFRGSQRLTLRCRPAPLDMAGTPSLPLGPETTILLTGGARGITAAVACELARRYRPTLVLVGRSPLPEETDPADVAGLMAPAEIKAALSARLRREGRPAGPAIVEVAYQRLLHDREIRANLARLRQAGSRVHYCTADVRDEAALTAAIEDAQRRFGGLDGVIHGAGVIQDKLIRDKTPESFDRVFGTKVDGARTLARCLRFERLKFCVFFTSVAGRFGNRGQADYAAANEVLSKLALELDRHGPCRVVSLAWGPWSGIGMVSDLEQHLGRRGLQMIPPDVGPAFLVEELLYGRKGDVEVVVAGEVGQLARPERESEQREAH
jgi:acyl transferase domain-containing protein/NAD(P)H-dependent flavin oxidoreductase YrpB (nitropropane dioxygenase family)/NAD(P)-dependent dehydrogenase (short-subunit alcohol dehydrogenase family)